MSEQPTTVASLAADGVKWLWNNYGEGFIEWLKAKTKDKVEEKGIEITQNRWKAFQWQRAEKNYKEKLAKLYGTTRIFGNSESTPLSGIFTDLYIMDKPLALRRYNLIQLQASDEKLHGHDVRRRDGIAVVKQKNSHRLFILGKPGAGKTTFLKYITLQTVKGKLQKTPVFVGLREWSETNKTLMDFIVEQFSICNFPKAESFIDYLLEQGNAILLLDGLDEVNENHNARVIQAVITFCKKYDKTQCLITCRVAATDYSFETFKYVEVADFTSKQIETFVKKWFRKEPIKREKFLTEFKLEQYRGLRELASSPLLLGMLCLAFAYSMEFTMRRVDIYDDAIDALLRKWDSSRAISRDVIYQGLNHHLKKRLFAAIAYKTFSDNQYLLKEQELANYLAHCLKKLPNTEKQIVDGEVVLKAIEAQHGIFVERAQKIHSFAHLTFQEYFTACAIKGNVNHQKELMQHIIDPRWREVFSLTASLLDDADEFFSFFKTAISDLISKDDTLVGFLQWIEHKANSVQGDYQIREVRFFYMISELTLALERIIDLNFNLDLTGTLDLDLSLARALDLAHAFAHTFGQARIFGRTLAHTSALALERALILEHALDLEHAINLESHSKDMSCDYLLNVLLITSWLFAKSGRTVFNQVIKEKYQEYLEFYLVAVDKIHILGFEYVTFLLTQLKNQIPERTATQNDWKLFAEQLADLLRTHRNIDQQWDFTNTQNKLLANYFQANLLLLDCLKLATVSDREAIKNGLFLWHPSSGAGFVAMS